ncbi:hypothetical protein MMC20_000005 [Loxospora ochrophaea]|nr:hypothetical protein [Loxospora ochrophaea]
MFKHETAHTSLEVNDPRKIQDPVTAIDVIAAQLLCPHFFADHQRRRVIETFNSLANSRPGDEVLDELFEEMDFQLGYLKKVWMGAPSLGMDLIVNVAHQVVGNLLLINEEHKEHSEECTVSDRELRCGKLKAPYLELDFALAERVKDMHWTESTVAREKIGPVKFDFAKLNLDVPLTRTLKLLYEKEAYKTTLTKRPTRAFRKRLTKPVHKTIVEKDSAKGTLVEESFREKSRQSQISLKPPSKPAALEKRQANSSQENAKRQRIDLGKGGVQDVGAEFGQGSSIEKNGEPRKVSSSDKNEEFIGRKSLRGTTRLNLKGMYLDSVRLVELNRCLFSEVG